MSKFDKLNENLTYHSVEGGLHENKVKSNAYWTQLYQPSIAAPKAPYFLAYLEDELIDGEFSGDETVRDDELSFENCWKMAGCFIFLGDLIEPHELHHLSLRLHKTLCARLNQHYPLLAWFDGPKIPQIIFSPMNLAGNPIKKIKAIGSGDYPTAVLNIGKFSVKIADETTITVTETQIEFGNPIDLTCPGYKTITSKSGKTQLDLIDEFSGCLKTPISTSLNDLMAIGGAEFRNHPGTGSGIQYPLFTGNNKNLEFALSWNVAAPLDPLRSRIAFSNPSKVDALETYYRTPAGQPLYLKPAESDDNDNLYDQPLSGFGFGRSSRTVLKTNEVADEDAKPKTVLIQEFEVSGLDYYLTPCGPFEVRTAPEVSRKKPTQIMCGANGSEYLSLLPDDLLSFVPDNQNFGHGHAQQHRWATAWTRIVSGSVQGGFVGASYCKQADSTPYFDNQPGYAPPVSVQLFDLSEDGGYPDIAFPLFPYAGIYSPLDLNNQDPDKSRTSAIDTASINLDFSPQAIKLRDRQLGRESIFTSSAEIQADPVLFNFDTHERLSGYIRTAEGMLGAINDNEQPDGARAGSVNRFYLAKAPNKADFFALNPGASGAVDPDLADAILGGSDLVIITDPDKVRAMPDVPGFKNEIKLADFPFQLDVGPDKAIVLFKFANDTTLVEMLAQAQSPAGEPKHFLGDGNLVKTIKKIQKAIEIAEISQKSDEASTESAGHDARHKPAFGHFLSIINDPRWTGFLAINCPLDYEKLPPDVATLIGGIRSNTKLAAHHLGVTMNRPRTQAQTDPIQTSSIFAVVFYERDLILNAKTFAEGFEIWKNDLESVIHEKPDFETLRLEVLFENSTQHFFSTRIALTSPELFGADFDLIKYAEQLDSQEARTMVIDGKQIRHPNGTGSLIFEWPLDRVFNIQKDDDSLGVLSSITFRDVRLRGISTKTSSDGKKLTATSVFEHECDLEFFDVNAKLKGANLSRQAQIDHDADGIADTTPLGDLFSYSTLRLDAYGIRTRIDLYLTEKHFPDISMSEDLSAARIEPNGTNARPGSFVASMPLQVSKVKRVADWSTESHGGWWAKSNALPGIPTKTPSGSGYAIEYDIPMGNSGGQEKTPTQIKGRLCMAWTPAGVFADDAHGLWFSLGGDNMNLQGILRTSVDQVRVRRVPQSDDGSKNDYSLRLENYQVHVFGHTLPKVKSAMVIKPSQKQPKGKLAWILVPDEKLAKPVASLTTVAKKVRRRRSPTMAAMAVMEPQPMASQSIPEQVVTAIIGDKAKGLHDKTKGKGDNENEVTEGHIGVMYAPVYISHGKIETEFDPVTSTNFIGEAIEELIGSPLAQKSASEEGAEAGDNLVVASHMLLPTIDFKFLMQDNTFYGGRLEFRKDPTQIDGSEGANLARFLMSNPAMVTTGWGGGPALQKIWDKLDGGKIEVYYKHLETGIGMVSANLVLPTEMATFRRGDASKRLGEIEEELEKESDDTLAKLKEKQEHLTQLKDEANTRNKPRLEDATRRITDNHKKIADLKEELTAAQEHLKNFHKKRGPKTKSGKVSPKIKGRKNKDKAIKAQADVRKKIKAAQKNIANAQAEHDHLENEGKQADNTIKQNKKEQIRTNYASTLLEMAFKAKQISLKAEQSDLEQTTPEFHLGNIGLAIYVGQDVRFRVAFGWPIDENPFEIILPKKLGGSMVPFVKAALYFAYLSPEDLPETFGDEKVPHYGNIFSGGLALAVGKKYELEKGPLTFEATYEFGAAIQVYYAEPRPRLFLGTDEKYFWGCFQLSITGKAEIKVDLVIIAIEASITIKIALSLAVETEHQTRLELTVDVKASASVTIVFVTIHVSFHTHVNIGGPWKWGDGPLAMVEGPTPQKVTWPSRELPEPVPVNEPTLKAEKSGRRGRQDNEPAPERAMASMAMTDQAGLAGHSLHFFNDNNPIGFEHEIQEAASHHEALDNGWTEEVPEIELHFLVQTTAIANRRGTWIPQGIASLLLDIGADNPEEKFSLKTGFSQLSAWMMAYLHHHHGPAVSDNLGWNTDSPDRAWIDKWLQTISFDIQSVDLNEKLSKKLKVCIFPMLPDMELHTGQGTKKFGQADTIEDKIRKDYFEFWAKSLFAETDDIKTKIETWKKEAPVKPGGETPEQKKQKYEKALRAEIKSKNARNGKDTEKDKRAYIATKRNYTRAKKYAESLKGQLEQAEAERYLNDNEETLGHIIRLKKEQATLAAHHKTAGNLSRILSAGKSISYEDSKSGKITFKSLYQESGQQFHLDGSTVSLLQHSVDHQGESSGIKAIIPDAMIYDQIDHAVFDWNKDQWTVHQLPPVMKRQRRFLMSHHIGWDHVNEHRTIAPFSDDLRLALELSKTGNQSLHLTDTKPKAGQAHISHEDVQDNWNQAAPALVIPIALHRVYKIENGVKIPVEDVVELEGTDEAHRALLGQILNDPTNMTGMNIYCLSHSSSSHKYKTFSSDRITAVKTNLSTATGGAATGETSMPSEAPYFAKLGGDRKSQTANIAKFLQLIWEASVVHAGGFLLKFNAKTKLKDLFEDKKKVTIKLVVGPTDLKIPEQTGQAYLPIKSFHNAIIGDKPKGHVMATLAHYDKKKRDHVIEYDYVPSHPFGRVGVEIIDKDPTAHLDALPSGSTPALLRAAQIDHIRNLYNVFTCKLEQRIHWSAPIHGIDIMPANGVGAMERHYIHIAEIPLKSGDNIYNSVGTTKGARLRVADIFGNVSPPQLGPLGNKALTLKSIYNDAVKGVGEWPGTRSTYRIVSSKTGPELQFDFTFNKDLIGKSVAEIKKYRDKDQSGLTDKEKDIQAQKDHNREIDRIEKAKELLAEYQHIAAQLGDPNLHIWVETTLSPQIETSISKNLTVKSELTTFVAAIIKWLSPADQKSGFHGDPAPNSRFRLGLKKTYPVNWTWRNPAGEDEPAGDLRELNVTMIFHRGAVTRKDARDIELRSNEIEANWFSLPKAEAIDGHTDMRDLMPSVQRAKTTVLADQHLDAKQPQRANTLKNDKADGKTLGLSGFAMEFEKAYAGFDGKNGRLKIATGINSDPKSVNFGKATIEIMRWAPKKGVSIERAKGDALFSAPVPVNSHLITGRVTGLGPDNQERSYSSVDLDTWAKDFLASVEALFDPEIAFKIADQGPPEKDKKADKEKLQGFEYDRLAENKAELAATVKQTLDWIYQGDYKNKSNQQTEALVRVLAGAEETMLQAMLRDLNNDYDTAVIAQIPMTVNLNGQIEPWYQGTPAPNVFGPISRVKKDEDTKDTKKPGVKDLPYSFSNAKLPLRNLAKSEWLNFLVNAKNTEQQSFFEVELEYPVTSVEHNIQPDKAMSGYVPSSWLSFVLPVDNYDDKTRRNTLTTPLGVPITDVAGKAAHEKTIIPVPLRSFPPNAKLLRQSAIGSYQDAVTPASGQSNSLPEIEDILTWNYHLDLSPPRAAQDRLVLQIVFNEEVGSLNTATKASEGTSLTNEHTALFDALARYRYVADSPKLAKPEARAAEIKTLNTLIENVRDAWKPVVKKQMEQRHTRVERTDLGSTVTDKLHETWEFKIVLQMTANAQKGPEDNRAIILEQLTPGLVIWPVIEGLDGPQPAPLKNDKSEQPLKRQYTYRGQLPDILKFTWKDLYIFQYQSAHAGAYVLRNERLAPPDAKSEFKKLADDWNTNPTFVYRTEMIRFSTPVIPLISVGTLAPIHQPHRADGITQMLDRIRHAHDRHSAKVLRLEAQVKYSYDLLLRADESSIRPNLPIFMAEATIAEDGPEHAEDHNDELEFDSDVEAGNEFGAKIDQWLKAHTGTKQDNNPGFDFALTLFATKIVKRDYLLPLVKIGKIEINSDE